VIERFDTFVERCLYHPERGFYTSGAGAAGRRGDFLTSPEVGPLFGEVLARWLDDVWDRLGRPDPFPVYDIGTGPGTLARQLAAATGPSAEAMVVEGLDRAHGADSLPDLAGAVVIANELLDNIPFRVIELRGGCWHELFVATGPEGPVEQLEPIDEADGALRAVIERLPVADLADGARAPVQAEAARWVAEVLAAGPSALIAFDYGAATTGELVRRGGWLRTYRRHEVGTDPLADPGSWDITTDIAVDQLPAPAVTTDQAAFLRRWGIEELVDEGRRYWAEHAARPDLTAFRMRSRVSEAEALLDPGGLGGWVVCAWEQGQQPESDPIRR
jgi:SAM-dependent MidA family methyltransferase